MSIKLTDKDQGDLEWWCRHYKDGIGYLVYRMNQYFEAKDIGDEKGLVQLEKIIRVSLPHYLEVIET